MEQQPAQRPLSWIISTIQDGRFLKLVFLGMLGLSVGAVLQDFREMVANAPVDFPATTRTDPAPLELPKPGDQTRPYFPRTMPLGPGSKKPSLPGYFGPFDSEVMAGPLQFHFGEGDKATAIGTIDAGAAARFAEFLKTHDREITELHLHSPGGSVTDALSLSRQIRSAGISTNVPDHAYCASACPLVLAGGLYRSAGKQAFIGVHQAYALPTAIGSLHRGMAEAQTISAACQQLLVDMGVDLKVWVRALETPPQSLYFFTQDEMSRYRLANNRGKTGTPEFREKIADVNNLSVTE
jgi:hypothetical protein